MSIADADTKVLARRLLAAYAGPPIAPIAGELPAGDIAAAYAVQLAQVATWEAGGRRPAGRKIGLTNPTVQRQLGVSEPDFGHLFADMIYGENEPLPLARLHQPRVEAEVALMLGEDLDRPDISVLDVVRATEWVLPALEIVGSRIADWRIGIVDTVADNASSGLLVLGGPARPIAGIDLVRCPMTMTINGVVVSEGTGADCLGNPLNAAAWLARRSRDFGRPLRAGELILTGALGPMASLAPGDRVEAVIDGLGRVSTLVSTEPAESEKA